MVDVNVHHGMNRRDALTMAAQLGCMVENVNRTGEVRVRHPHVQKIVVLNNRRKDAPRELTALLLKVIALSP